MQGPRAAPHMQSERRESANCLKTKHHLHWTQQPERHDPALMRKKLTLFFQGQSRRLESDLLCKSAMSSVCV